MKYLLIVLFLLNNTYAKKFENSYYKCTASSTGNGIYMTDISIQEAKSIKQFDLSVIINEKKIKIGTRTTYNFIRNDIVRKIAVDVYGEDVFDSKERKWLNHYEIFLFPTNLKLYFSDVYKNNTRVKVFTCRKPTLFEKTKMMIF